MSNSVQVIDELLTTFDQEIIIQSNKELDLKPNISSIPVTNDPNNITTCNKLKNGTTPQTKTNNNITTSPNCKSTVITLNNPSAKPKTPSPPPTYTEKKQHKQDNDIGIDDDRKIDELSEEEALRLAMEMSMDEDDRKLVYNIQKEIKEAQAHLSDWFAGNFPSIRHKNRAWFNFSRRLHHQFEMYRIEQGIIQPLSYQFFIQFIALMYGTMKNANKDRTNSDDTLYIDQHKIKNIEILSADSEAIKYLKFAQGLKKCELVDAVYAKFESLALDPMAPNQWKFNHVMFIRAAKAPNGLLWAKWHMQ